MQQCSNLYTIEPIANFPGILNFVRIDGKQESSSSSSVTATTNIESRVKLAERQTTNNEFKLVQVDDALAEPNVQRRACWFNTWTECAAPARHPSQPPVFVTTSRHPAQETIKIHVQHMTRS